MAKVKRAPRGKSGVRRRDAARTDAAPLAAEDVRFLARDAALAALHRLAELARSDDERVALAASQELLNRAFGKSISAASEDQTNAPQPLVIRIVRFGAESADEPCRPIAGAKPGSIAGRAPPPAGHPCRRRMRRNWKRWHAAPGASAASSSCGRTASATIGTASMS